MDGEDSQAALGTAGHISSCCRDLRPWESTYTPMALKHSSSSLLEISTAQRASRFCWGMKARVWSSWWRRLTGVTSPWTLWRSGGKTGSNLSHFYIPGGACGLYVDQDL